MGNGGIGENSGHTRENNSSLKYLVNFGKNKIKKPIFALTVAIILLFATFIAWPDQMALGHESAWHDFCWDQTLTAFDFLPDLVPPLFPWLKAVALILAVLLGILLSLACSPQIVPPPDRNILLECNTIVEIDGRRMGGFVAESGSAGKNSGAKKITDDNLKLKDPEPTIPTVGQFKSDAFVRDDSGDLVRIGFGIIHFVESTVPLLLILGPALVGKALPGLGDFLLNAIFGFFDYKFFMETVYAPNDGHAAHPVARVKEVSVSREPTAFYSLGDNQINYNMESTIGTKDSATYRFNVVDVVDPDLVFQHNPVVLEANAHFGFDVDSISISELGIITGVDECDPTPKVTYLGQTFYPLTIIEPEQIAPWRVTEHTYSAWEENPDAPFINLKELPKGLGFTAGETYQKLVEKRLKKDLQELKVLIESADLARKFGPEQIKVLEGNIADQKLKLQKLELQLELANGIKKNSPIADVDVEIGKFKKSIAAEKQKLSKLELDLDKTAKKVASADVDIKTLSTKFAKTQVKLAAVQKVGGGALGALGAFFSEFTKSTPKRITEGGLHTDKNQTIIVVDTIAPDILVLENLAVEVDNPADTVELEILPPLLFDVADPFPTLTHNATGSFEELAGDTLTADFGLGLTKIAWNATDFSGNHSPMVMQLVNIKETGTNIQSVAFNQTVPNAFTDVPLEIMLNATNPDRDPIEFFIEENPEDGIIESPIEAIFQNKFQLKGTISRLKGITVSPVTEEIRLTDSENDRVMKLDSMGALDIAFSTAGVVDRPEGIDRIDLNNFILSEWENERIIQAETSTGVAILAKTFDISGLFEEPQNIAVNGDDIFVTDSFNKTVTRIDKTDAFLAPRTLGMPNDIVPDGNSLFVADSGNNRIIRFDSTVFDFQFGTPGNGNGQFDMPLGITKNSTNIVIADTNNDRLQFFDLNGNFVGELGTSGSANDQFLSPSDVALNSTHILVADRDNHRIQIFNSSAAHKFTLGTGTAGSANDDLSSPSGFSLNTTHIFVADTGNHRIQIFNNSGSYVQTLGDGTPSIDNGKFNGPLGVAVNATHIFVADTNNHRIQIFNSSGAFVSKFGSLGSANTQFDNPTRVRLDASNNIYVADSGNNRIQKFDSAGNFVQTLDSKVVSGFDDYITSFQLSFNDLQADSVDINSDGEIFVADWNQQRIVKLVRDAGQIPQLDISLFGLTDPKNIAINSTKNIFITDRANQKILTLNDDGTLKGEIDLSGIPLTPYGIAIDDSDNIFVSDWSLGSEKIAQVDEQGNQIGPSFGLQTVFSSPQDIAVNGTFFWITDDASSGKKIVQIRSDKGKLGQFDLDSPSSTRLGLSFVDQANHNTILFTNSTDGFVYQLDLLSGTTSILNELIGKDPHGIASTPMLPRFLGEFVINGSGGLDRPTGIIFGPDLNLYVSSTGDNSVKRFNGTTGQYIDDFVAPTLGDLSYPRDMLFGIDGNLYVASFDTDSIKRYNGTSGEYIDDFVQPNEGALDGPVGLILDPSGNLLVSNSLSHNIIQFNGSSGKFLKFFVENIASGLVSPQSMSFGPDGNLYVSSKDSNEILRYNGITGAFLGNFTSSERLNQPVALAFDFLNNLLYVTSKGEVSDEILQYNATTGEFIGVLTTGELETPGGITLDPTGLVYSTSFNNNEILRYGVSPVSMFVSDWTSMAKDRLVGLNSAGEEVFGFDFDISMHVNDPRYIASDSLGNIWVADVQAGDGVLVNFDGGIGTKQRVISLSDIPTSDQDTTVTLELEDGSMATLDDDGNLVVDSTVPKISVIPEGIALDSTDSFYVSDWNNYRIVKLTPQGTFVEQFKLNSTFTDPKDLVVIDEGDFVRLFVSDGATGEVIELRSDRLLSELELEEIDSSINGLTKDGDSLFLTSTNAGTNGKLFEMDSQGLVSEITDVFIEPDGIAVTAADKIYVTDWKDERIILLDDLGERKGIFDIAFARFLELNKLRDIDVKEEAGSVSFWVSDSRRAEIPKIVFATKTIANQPSVADKFVFMSSLAVDSTDDFYVTSTQNSTFVKFSERGSLKNNVTVSETRALIDVSTAHNSTDNTDQVYLAIGNPSQIIKYNSTLHEIDSASIDQRATSVVADSVSNIYVSFTNSTIAKFSNDFTPKLPLVIPDGSAAVSDMVVDSVDNLFAADNELHRVHKFNLISGNYLGWLGKCDVGDGCDLNDNHTKGFSLTADNVGTKNGGDFSQFFEPTDITVDRTGNLYVADIQQREDVNSPRIQKFSNTGFFIENFLSNVSNTKIKGNFNNTQSIAVGSNFFYVADIEKLHFFDINPFSEVTTDLSTNVTSSKVTYQANQGFPPQPLPPAMPIAFDFDNFKFKVSDGFVDSNIALVNITVNNPDIDRDGIFFNVDPLPLVGSTTFADLGNKTTGVIVDYGDQVLTIRDSREQGKGVFIQADVTPLVPVNPMEAKISGCDNSVQVELNPGNRLQLTCGSGQVDVIRGNIKVQFFDDVGRNATATIGVGDGLHFNPFNFAFTAPDTNHETIDVLVKFNSKQKIYMVPPGEEVIVDTAIPTINQDVCSVPLILESEIIFGINATSIATTDHLNDINKFLNLVVLDVDNGFPQMTQDKETLTLHNATKDGKTQFPLGTTTTLFTAVDDIGNTATCTSTITVEDTTRPVIKPAMDTITVETPLHDDVAAVNFDSGTTFDLPEKLGDPPFDADRILGERVHQPQCLPPSGSTFVIGDNAVGCVATDREGNVGNANFTITVTKNPTDVFIDSITASDNGTPSGYSDRDTIIVLFSQDTNKPPADTKSDIDALLKFTENDNVTAVSLGQDYTGKYINPKLLVITINDSTGGNPTPGDTRFAIQPTSNLASASGKFVASTTPSPQLAGNFTSISAPQITAFVADDPVAANHDEGDDMSDDVAISPKDELILRFDKPTNRSGGLGTLDKDAIDSVFSFADSLGNPISPGDNYEGRWINALTFKITILELNTNVALDPAIGDTIAIVKPTANLKNEAESSVVSVSKSKPLTGSFAPFNVQKSVEPNGTATTVLPSGLTVGMTFPDGSDKVTISKSMASEGSFRFLGHTIEINSANDNACENGCTLSFTFTSDDLKSQGISLNRIRILHDENDDGKFQQEERLIPIITPTSGPGPFTASVTIFSLSDFGIGQEITSGGGGSVATPPKFTTQSITGSGVIVACPDDPTALCQGAIIQDVIKLTNSMPTAKIETGKTVRLSMLLYENSGIQGLEHISLYMNLRGFERALHQSDTFIRLHQGESIINDPHGYFQSAEVSLIPRGIFIEAAFDITFAKPMDLSDLIFRGWDHELSTRDAKFLNAIEVIEPQIGINTDTLTILSGENIPDESQQEDIIEWDLLNKWAGFSEEVVTDSELLDIIGLDGTTIPSWYKNMIAKWMIQNEVVSENEFLNALNFFYNNGLLQS